MNRKIGKTGIRIFTGGVLFLLLLTSCQKKADKHDNDSSTVALAESVTSNSKMQSVMGQVVSEDTEYFMMKETASLPLMENETYLMIDRTGNENGMVELGEISEFDINGYISDSEEYVLLFFDTEVKLQKKMNVKDLISDEYNRINGLYPAGTNEFVIAVYPSGENVEQQMWLYRYDFAGNRIGDRIVIQNKISSENDSVDYYSFLIDKNGLIFAVGESYSTQNRQKMVLTVFDSLGSELFTLEDNSGENSDNWNFTNQLFSSDGHVYIMGNETKGAFLTLVDTTQQTLGERIFCDGYNFYQMQMFGDSLYSSNGLSLQKIKMQDREILDVFEWKNLDIPDGANSDWFLLSEDKIVIISQSEGSQPMKWHLLEKTEINPNVGKKIIQIVSMNVDVEKAVYRYNQENSEYRIEVKNYSDHLLFDTEDKRQAWISQFQMDMISGNLPDILIDDEANSMNFSILSSQGIFADLNPLMSTDPSFDESGYFENILKISEKDNKLFYVSLDFSLQGILGNDTIVGDIRGWTFDEFSIFADNLSDGIALFENGMTANRFLLGVLSGSLDDYIDYANKTANFQSEQFIALLNFCKNYCRTANGEVDDMSLNNGATPVDLLLKRGELALFSEGYINSIDHYRMTLSSFGENTVIMGYPSQNNVGPVCVPVTSVGISSSSPYQQEAWGFIKQLLGGTTQQNNDTFPVLKSKFEEQAQVLSDSEAQSLRETIASVDSDRMRDERVNFIIQDEVQSFFSGDKPAETVAETIQSRVQTHLNES